MDLPLRSENCCVSLLALTISAITQRQRGRRKGSKIDKPWMRSDVLPNMSQETRKRSALFMTDWTLMNRHFEFIYL